ncbi:hypothetical protein [Bradyrhizobium sp. 613_E4_N2_2]|uniref:hypothetical protein n=1 Tax=Bradyrhizobium sp. 613_E4_N2_2 TaxID=3240371 RepID=UPI003F8A5091
MQPLTILSLRAAAAITANDNGAAVDVSAYTGNGYLVLNSSATGGAGQTSTVKLQHSDDGSTGWTDTDVTFDAVTNAAASHQVQLVSFDQFKKFVRVVNTLAGTSPTVTAAVEAVGVKA